MSSESKIPEQEWNRKFAASLFNWTWKLLEKKDRTQEEDEMIHAAHASSFHWGKVGTPVNFARGDWPISRVYSVLKRPEPSLFHAQWCLDECKKGEIGEFTLAFAYEALARASAVAGKMNDCRRYIAEAKEAGEKIEEKEDKNLLLSELKTAPGYED